VQRNLRSDQKADQKTSDSGVSFSASQFFVKVEKPVTAKGAKRPRKDRKEDRHKNRSALRSSRTFASFAVKIFLDLAYKAKSRYESLPLRALRTLRVLCG